MVHLKSKIQKTVNPATDFSAYPEFIFVAWHMTDSGYIAEFKYFYIDADDQKQPINYLSNRRDVSIDLVNAIAATIEPDPTLTYTQQQIKFLTYGALAIIGTDKPFGLNSGDWEIVT